MTTTLDAAGNVPAPVQRLYAYCMDRLGLRDVLRYCRAAAPGVLASRFRWDAPGKEMEQCGLWGGAQ